MLTSLLLFGSRRNANTPPSAENQLLETVPEPIIMGSYKEALKNTPSEQRAFESILGDVNVRKTVNNTARPVSDRP